MRSAFALRINSGKKFFNFGIAELLRALRYSIFTGEGSPLQALRASSPKGEPLGAAGNCIVADEAVPLGKVATTNGSRQKGLFSSLLCSIKPQNAP